MNKAYDQDVLCWTA